jgi:hypothetical protein
MSRLVKLRHREITTGIKVKIKNPKRLGRINPIPVKKSLRAFFDPFVFIG